MILRILGADFSSANIGTLSTYIISKNIGGGAAFDIPNFVDKNSSVNWTITLDEGYIFGTYSVTMGGVVITPSVTDNVMTISITEVTGNVRIVVATVNENAGEEDDPIIPDEPVVPPVEPEEPETENSYTDVTQYIIDKKSVTLQGTLSTSNDYFAIDKIPISGGYDYTLNNVRNFAIFDENENLLLSGGLANAASTTYPMPANAKFLSTCYKHADVDVENVHILKDKISTYINLSNVSTDSTKTFIYIHGATPTATSPYYQIGNNNSYFMIKFENPVGNKTYEMPYARNYSLVKTDGTVSTATGAGSATYNLTTPEDIKEMYVTFKYDNLNPNEVEFKEL